MPSIYFSSKTLQNLCTRLIFLPGSVQRSTGSDLTDLLELCSQHGLKSLISAREHRAQGLPQSVGTEEVLLLTPADLPPPQWAGSPASHATLHICNPHPSKLISHHLVFWFWSYFQIQGMMFSGRFKDLVQKAEIRTLQKSNKKC